VVRLNSRTLLLVSDDVRGSLAFSTEYRVVFRNSGFAAATVLIRLALTAPPYVNVLLSVGGATFIVLLSLAYNALGPRAGDPRLVATGAGPAGPPPAARAADAGA
jgi:hypothetical protein